MRIRKRKVPFPLSCLSPVPLSDPQFGDQLQLQTNPNQNFSPDQDDKVSNFSPHSSGQPNHPIGDASNDPDFSDYSCKQEQNKKEESEDQEEGEKSNDSRKQNFLGAKTPNVVFQESISFLQGKNNVEGRNSQKLSDWKLSEGERAFPFKKRRRSLGIGSYNGEIAMVEKDKKMKTKTKKPKMKSEENADKSANKKVRGGAVMEGSRCSRVNGRGWRCCQPTLVGYALCEHHLGKGRLRSITNATSKKLDSKPLSSSPDGEETKDILLDHKAFDVCGNEEEKQPPLLVSKKKQKLGMVKARSISSLLGQADNAIEVAESVEE